MFAFKIMKQTVEKSAGGGNNSLLFVFHVFFVYMSLNVSYSIVPQITINKVNKTTKKVKEKRDNIK